MRTVCVLFLLILAVGARAQRSIRVLDVETHAPVVSASVRADGHAQLLTDSLGRVLLPARFDSLTVSHLNYAVERLSAAEVRDTVWLFATDNMLDEVTVVSFNQMGKSMEAWQKRNKPLPDPGAAPLRINLSSIAKLLGIKKRGTTKREKVKDLLEKWDNAPQCKAP